MHKSWNQKKVAEVLFMNVKVAFDYVSKVKLAQWIKELKINNSLIG